MTVDPTTLVRTRLALHAAAEQVLAAARYRATGRIGLRTSPGGIATPPFPSDHGERTVAIDGVDLVVDDDRGTRRATLTTLAAAAELAEVEPGPPDVYPAATDLAPDEPLGLDATAAAEILGWFARGAEALEALRHELADLDPSEVQLWPEHFDLGFSAAEVNYGISPGDGPDGLPYAYVGPWTPPEPDGGFWNQPFGASRPAAELTSTAGLLAFFEEGRRRASELPQG